MIVHDVTAVLFCGMPVWPGDPEVTLKQHGPGLVTRGPAVSAISLGSHSGTHVDAPRHLFRGGRGVDGIPLEALVGAAELTDIAGEGPIEQGHIEAMEVGCQRLLLRRLPTNVLKDPLGGVVITAAAALQLLRRGIRLVGTESPSIDPPELGAGPAHRILLEAGVVILEGLRLGDVSAGPYLLVCAPLLIADADGAPARVFLLRQ